MTEHRRSLPFLRGEWSQPDENIEINLDDTNPFPSLEGQIFEVQDDRHGTGTTTKLRVVKNDSGGDITVAHRFQKFSAAGEYDFGRRCAGQATVLGSIAKPMDDAYLVGSVIPQYALFYLIESGWCDVQTAAANVANSAGEKITTDAGGRIEKDAAAAGETPLGIIGATTAVEDAEVAVFIFDGIQGGEI